MVTTRRGISRFAGLVLAGAGVAHLPNPRLFTPLSRRAFPRRTQLYTYLNGVALTLVGLGLRMARTRGLATIVGVGYAAHVSGRASRATRRSHRVRTYRAAAFTETEPRL